MKKIKFKRYDIRFQNHDYCVLIPYGIETLFIYDYGGEEGTGWVGNRNAIKALLYSAAVLGFNPTNKIIYFPIRKNRVPERYLGADQCDLVLTTHQVHLKRSSWIEIRRTLQYKKAKTYILNYDEKRTERYFCNSAMKWENTNARWNKEYLIEMLQDETLFQVFSRMQFQQIYLELHEFLKSNLEKMLQKNVERAPWLEVPFTYMPLKMKRFRYRNKKQLSGWGPYVDFYDEKIDQRVLESKKNQKQGGD